MVDDEVFNLEIIKSMMDVLQVKNFEERTVCCLSGEQFIHHVEDAIAEGDPFRYALMIADCSMPILDGYETVR